MNQKLPFLHGGSFEFRVQSINLPIYTLVTLKKFEIINVSQPWIERICLNHIIDSLMLKELAGNYKTVFI